MSHKQKTTPVQDTAAKLTQTDIDQQQAEAAKAQGSIDTANQTMARANPALDNILTPQANGKTALEQSLTQQLTGQTAKSYENAMVNARRNTLASGLATSPAGVGNENAVGMDEARALGQIPAQVESQVVPQELQAAGLVNSQAGLQNGQAGLQAGLVGAFNPNSALGTTAQLQEQQNQANQSLWSGLAKAALGAISYSKGGLTV